MMLGALLLSVVINPYFLIPIIILFILFYYDRQLYLKTSKNIKRIEGVGELIKINNLKHNNILLY